MVRQVIFGILCAFALFSVAHGQDFGYNIGVPQVEQGRLYAEYTTAPQYQPRPVNPYAWRPAENLRSPFYRRPDVIHRHYHYYSVPYYRYYYYQYPHAARYWYW